MRVTFDAAKNASNIAKHGLALADFDGFDIVASAETDDRFDYGEIRYRAFGRIDGVGYAIVFTAYRRRISVDQLSPRPRQGDASL